MNVRALALTASGILFLSVGALGAGVGAATAATTNGSIASPSSVSATETTAAATVAAYETAHPQPVANSKDPVVFQQEVTASLAWWKAAPLTAMYAQYGCTVSDPTFATATDGNGVRELNVSYVSTCPTTSAAAPTTDFSAPRANALPASSHADATITPDSSFSGCSPEGAYCFNENFSTGSISAKFTLVVSGSFTGHVRLGLGSGSGSGTGCSNGTLYAQSANHTIGEGSSITVVSTASVDRTWSDASIYESTGAQRGHFCDTF